MTFVMWCSTPALQGKQSLQKLQDLQVRIQELLLNKSMSLLDKELKLIQTMNKW